MTKLHLHPYRAPAEIAETVDRLHKDVTPLVHPQRVLEKMRKERPRFAQVNGLLADHIVGLAGTMVFFYFLCLVLAGWSFWQSVIGHDNGFDPFPYAFLFFVLGGIMQSLFVPTMLTASNRTAERDQIKDEADHRAWSHLYDVNDEQLALLKQLVAALSSGQPPAGSPPA